MNNSAEYILGIARRITLTYLSILSEKLVPLTVLVLEYKWPFLRELTED